MNNQVNEFAQLSPVVQAFLATIVTWLVTVLGAAVVFFRKELSRRLLDASRQCT